jgi:predicted membrane protein
MHNNINEDKKNNIIFGILFFIIFFLISIYPLFKNENLNIWSLLIAIVLLLITILKPSIFRPLNKIWIKFGVFLGKFISPIIMFIIFFAVVTPTGILMKIFRKDTMNLKSNRSSYWINRSSKPGKMNKQF